MAAYYIEVLDSLKVVDIIEKPITADAIQGVSDIGCQSCLSSLLANIPRLPDSDTLKIRDLPSAFWSELVDCWVCHPEKDTVNVNADLLHAFEPEVSEPTTANNIESLETKPSVDMWVGDTYVLATERLFKDVTKTPVHMDKKGRFYNSYMELCCGSCSSAVGEVGRMGSRKMAKLCLNRVRFVLPSSRPAISVSLSQVVSREILSHVGAHAVYRFVVEGRKSCQPVVLLNVVGWNAEIQARAMSSTQTDSLPDISGRCLKILFTQRDTDTFDSQAKQWLDDSATELISLLDADADSLLRILVENSRLLPPPLRGMANMTRSFLQIKLFESLQAQLAAGGHHVALLESQYCTSLAGMLKCMLDQVLGSLDEGQRATGNTRTTAIAGAKTISYDMGLLKLRWDEAPDGANSRSSRVVVILQDFEGFAPMVVDDFVRIATSYCQSVPIVVVLGLATSYESIHQSLTKASISMLNVEKFNLQRSKECIDAAIQSVFIRATDTLSFGAEAYKSLLDQFLLYNFSITSFVKKLKFAAMDFFYAHPLSVLASMLQCSAGGVLSVRDCPIRLSPEQAELIRMQKSVQRFLEQQLEDTGDRNRFRLALSNDDYLQKTALPQLLRRLVSFRAGYCLGIDLVTALQEMVPESLQKPIRTLHYYGIGQRFDDCAHWKALSAVMRRMKASDMERLLARLGDVADAAAIVDWDFATKDGLDIPQLLRQSKALLTNPEALAKPGSTDSGEPSKRIRTRTDMENRPFLLFDSSSSDQMLSALDKCCANIETILRACLSPYQSAPLYEVFYYKHSLLLDTTFSAQPRAAVQAALGKTAYYIDCDCCKAVTCDSDGSDMASEDGDDQRVMPSMHDTSIAYRLHQECGRMINLYDWHSAFSSVVEGESSKERGSLPCQRAIQARFMRAVEEMRLLGFIKSTQRKTDHVIRLTWGM
ncbi:Origin recognition complex subunit 3 [Coemansia spiralis]|uniref:Origin recognition complex subunit 3 n=1 Tax=Coemansia spiralis TaxID=417178 RepID=A0A9W8GIF1_9FUNG|nr:Origin recognition complex subunit 3 [Coemansia spiralis]